MEEVVANFTASRSRILGFVHQAVQLTQQGLAAETRPAKRRKMVDNREAVATTSQERRSTRSQTKRHASQTSASQQSPESTQNVVADSDAGSIYEDEPSASRHFDGQADHEPNDGLVACPSCSRRMKESLVNSHLDKCLAGEAPSPTPPPNDKTSIQSPRPAHIVSGTIAYSQTKPSTTNRLPTLNYSLLNDNAMRKRLKELGIPHDGSKELMRKRHMEWLNLWNANCDSLNPVSRLHLLKSLASWERTLGKQVAKDQQGPNGVMVKDFDRDRYAKKQRNEFDDLIARARQNRAVKNTEAEEPLDETTGPPTAQVDGPAEQENDCDTPQSFSAHEGSAVDQSFATDQAVDRRIPMIPTSNPIAIPDLDWRTRPQPDVNPPESTRHPPPSSQRSMSHDITA